MLIIATLIVSWGGDDTRLAAEEDRELQESEVDEAIVRALKYLSSQQRENGSWVVQAYGESTAATSLAVMSFMAAGHVPGEGPYGDQILKGIRWVMDQQQQNGLLIRKKSHGPMYSHGISSLMLAEVIGMLGKDDARKCREVLTKAIALILAAQNVPKGNRHAGGWRYEPTSRDADLSVTGWQLLALRASKNIGMDVPADNIDQAVEYVKNCATGARGGFGYQPSNGPTPTRTGTGILCLEICGRHKAEETLAGADFLLNNPLRPHSNYYYYGVYYCSVGMFKVGGKHWEQTRDDLVDQLTTSQNLDGSWDSSFGSERNMGKIYCTSMAVLGLAVEYQFLPIYQR
ncbi:MAG: terpene cyclase/mutase family protein [Planctomycetaceae bacterium]|nr:terpene cyclase/mutase family protein [Planctomycetaceae bacterium]